MIFTEDTCVEDNDPMSRFSSIGDGVVYDDVTQTFYHDGKETIGSIDGVQQYVDYS